MKAVLYDKETSTVLLTFDELKSYDTRKGEVCFVDAQFGQGSTSSIDFTIMELGIYEGEDEIVIGDKIDPALLTSAKAFKVVTTEDYIESLQYDSADLLMQLSMAKYENESEIALLREDLAMLAMETALKGGQA